MHKRLVIGLAAAVIIGGGTFGFAASLTPTSDSLGAGTVVVASCDSTVGVDYTAQWDTNQYEVLTATVTGIDGACAGKDISVTLTGAGGSLGEESSTSVVSPSTAFNFSGDNVSANAVTGVHVVIAGP